MSAKPEPSTVQEDPEDSISAAKNSKQQTFEEWLAARGNTAPTHVIGVSEDGGVEMYSHAVPQNGEAGRHEGARTSFPGHCSQWLQPCATRAQR